MTEKGDPLENSIGKFAKSFDSIDFQSYFLGDAAGDTTK